MPRRHHARTSGRRFVEVGARGSRVGAEQAPRDLQHVTGEATLRLVTILGTAESGNRGSRRSSPRSSPNRRDTSSVGACPTARASPSGHYARSSVSSVASDLLTDGQEARPLAEALGCDRRRSRSGREDLLATRRLFVAARERTAPVVFFETFLGRAHVPRLGRTSPRDHGCADPLVCIARRALSTGPNGRAGVRARTRASWSASRTR